MHLPNHEQALVPEAKIVQYLLNEEHTVGKHKAAFFLRFGFSIAAWQVMKDALLDHAAQHEVAEVNSMENGIHYVIEGTLTCPDGRSPIICSVWRIDIGSEIPRFITAYPGG